ncbi:MAG TPA: cytochrome c biogenesis protein CcsA [Spirochaetota bacterium]|nr:cytochrome c biogenesis protein CcsA [Spirochaetota bacterium]HPI89538.1 cytochrome c biogenesis protein CcsA [Spirochaetota bacterium]HPR49002.1 cytochrome c biogenesis protein CcsA [Spirochaetota bacterium]
MYLGSLLNGNTLLIIALLVSIAALFFLARSASGNPYALVTSRQLYYLTSILIVLASMLLAGSLLTHDFQNAYVYSNTSKDLPAVYLIAAFWAANQGSFLLWLLILNIFGVVVTRGSDENQNIILSIVVITQVFFLIILMVDSPFRQIWDVYKDVQPGFKPADGQGMNPLLVDPWMVSHPPVLFMGYASSVVPFGYALSALMKKDASIIIKRSYPWVLFSMISLGVGIFMGGYWAYKVLGWGGYWGWDPVENSSLIPWLISLALVHGIILQRKKKVLARTNIVLSLVYFILVFYSTFLTRSGVLSDFSVHSFADYGLAPFLVSFLLFYVVIALALFINRRGGIETNSVSNKILSWDTLAAFGVIVLIGFAAVVLVGTSMPIISGVFRDKPVAVTENFYNNIAVPFGILILVIMILSTLTMTGRTIKNRSVIVALVFSLTAGVLFNIAYTFNPIPHVFTIISLFVIVMCCYDLFKTRTTAIIPSRLTHIGTALLVIGIMASGYHSTSEQKVLHKDVEEEVSSMLMTFKGIEGTEKTALRFTARKRDKVYEIFTDYYFDAKTGSWYRAPYVIHEFAGDVYVSPLAFHSGVSEATSLLIGVDEQKSLGKLSVRFKGFRTENMASESPTIIADLVVDGKAVFPALKIIQGNSVSIDKKIPGTDRSVSIADIDVATKKVMISVTPGRDTVIPPDSAVIEVSKKHLIWIVWLGTAFITLGGIAAFYLNLRRSPA